MSAEVLRTIFNIENLLMMNVGVAAGVIIGALPGLNVVFAIAILLPLTFGMESIAGMYLMLGAYCGAVYGGSITAILLNTPGTPAASATTLDGYPMNQQGRGADALKAALIASGIGGLLSTIVLVFGAPMIAKASLNIQAPEYFSLCIFGLATVIGIAGDKVLKGIIMALLGLIVSTIGIDPVEGTQRLMFGNFNLMAGLKSVAILLGVFALAEVLQKSKEMYRQPNAQSAAGALRYNKATLKVIDILKHWKDILWSSLYGIVIGAIPGTGGVIAAMFSYNDAKRRSKHPERFGTGCLEGVIAPETANNATTAATLIPLLTFGIPGDASVAVLLGALTMQGITPGLSLFSSEGTWVYSIMIGLFLINVFMLLQGSVFTRVFANFSRIPPIILLPCIMILCVMGSFSISNIPFDIFVMIGAGLFGFLMRKFDMPIQPFIIGIVLGQLMETNLRRTLILSAGSPMILITRPVSAFFLLLAALALLSPLMRAWKRKKAAK